MKRGRTFAQDYTFAIEDAFNININTPSKATINGIPILTDATGAFTLGPIGSTPNANALSLVAGVLNVQPANATFGGVVTTGTQTFAGTKTFSQIDAPIISDPASISINAPTVNINGNPQVPITANPVGAVPNANGISVSGFQLTLEPADGTHPGVLTAGTQTIGGTKTFTQIDAPIISDPVEIDINAPTVKVNGNVIAPLTVGAFNVVSTPNVADITGSVLTIHAGDTTNPGVVTTGTQQFNGSKIFNGGIAAPNLTSLSSGTTPITIHASTININGTLDAQTISDGIGITVTTPTLAVTGNETVSGTLGVTGSTSLSTASTSGLATLNSASVTTTLGVTGNTSLSTVSSSGAATLNSAIITTSETIGTTLGVTGNTTLSTVSTSGAATLNSAVITNSATVGTTLGVTGNTTLTTVTTSGAATLNSASITNNETVGGTLAVTGNASFSTLSSTGASSPNSLVVATSATVGTTLGVTGNTSLSTVSTSGAATLNSASVTNNETVGGTLAVTGNTSLSTVSTSGAATLNSAVITNSATVGTTLGVTGNTSLSTVSTSGAATLNSATITNAATVGTTLGVTGNTSLSTVSSSGAATLNSGVVTTTWTVDGVLNTLTGLQLPTTGGGVGTLTYYETTTQSITFTAGAATSGAQTVQIERIGNIVFIKIPAFAVAFSSAAPFTAGTALPTRWRPTQTLMIPIFVLNGSIDVAGSWQIATTGIMTLGVGVPPGNFTSSNIGINNPVVVSYTIN